MRRNVFQRFRMPLKLKGLEIHDNFFSVVIFLIKGKSATVDTVDFME